MSEYRIAAIPTAYKGRQYRSRLEARWAAFFDLLGWQHEYEPFDLGKWSPDFLLTGRYGATLLVEIKPIQQFSRSVADKMVAACFARGMQREVCGYLLLGLAPTLVSSIPMVGWHGTPYSDEPRADWCAAPLSWVPDAERPLLRPDVIRVQQVIWKEGGPKELELDAVLEERHSVPIDTLQDYPEHTMRLWAQATNVVQWKPPA